MVLGNPGLLHLGELKYRPRVLVLVWLSLESILSPPVPSPFPHEGDVHGDGKSESSLMKQARGYKKSGLVDKRQIVASQLCKPPGLDDNVEEWKEESDGEWERVSEAS